MFDLARAGAVLTVDLDAVRSIGACCATRPAERPCAAVMKADAYGLGMDDGGAGAGGSKAAACSSPPTWTKACACAAGAGRQPHLRAARPAARRDRRIRPARFDPGAERSGPGRGLARACRHLQRRLPAALQFDTGMSRMGLAPADVDKLLADPAWKDEISRCW
jgi:alanine racemase